MRSRLQMAIDLAKITAPRENQWVALSKDFKKVLASGERGGLKLPSFMQWGIPRLIVKAKAFPSLKGEKTNTSSKIEACKKLFFWIFAERLGFSFLDSVAIRMLGNSCWDPYINGYRKERFRSSSWGVQPDSIYKRFKIGWNKIPSKQGWFCNFWIKKYNGRQVWQFLNEAAITG